jgi:hypothetical protein
VRKYKHRRHRHLVLSIKSPCFQSFRLLRLTIKRDPCEKREKRFLLVLKVVRYGSQVPRSSNRTSLHRPSSASRLANCFTLIFFKLSKPSKETALTSSSDFLLFFNFLLSLLSPSRSPPFYLSIHTSMCPCLYASWSITSIPPSTVTHSLLFPL